MSSAPFALMSEPPPRLVSASAPWREVIRRLRGFLKRFSFSPADRDDLLQDILLRLHRGLEELQEPSRFWPWVYQVARRALADEMRRKKRQIRWQEIAASYAEDLFPSEGDTPPFAEAVENDEPSPDQLLETALAYFLDRLPEPYREALTLAELEGLTQKEAAERLGISWSGMKSRIQRGRFKIKEEIDSICEIHQDARGHVIECIPRVLSQNSSCCTPKEGCSSETKDAQTGAAS